MKKIIKNAKLINLVLAGLVALALAATSQILTVEASPNSDYYFNGTVGAIGSAPTIDQVTLVNPTVMSRGNDGLIYVYNDSPAMPGADTTHRVITRFDADGLNPVYILIETPAGFSVKGMTVSASGQIYLTPANVASVGGGLVVAYDTNGYSGAAIAPSFLGQINGFMTTGNLGVPTINQVNGNVIVSGQFIRDSQPGVNYGVAEINLSTGQVVKFLVTTNGSSLSAATINSVVVCPNGHYFAAGYFQIGAQSYDVVRFDPDSGQVTAVAAPNTAGNGYQVSQWTITSINVDQYGNIYLSGLAGVSDSNGQWVGQYSIVKLDESTNFVSTIAAMGTAAIDQVDQLNMPGLVSIDTGDETVYVLDKDTSGTKALKVYKVNVQPPTAPTAVTTDPGSGTVTWQPPDNTGGTGNGGYTVTIVPGDTSPDVTPDPGTTTGTTSDPVAPTDDGTDDGVVDLALPPVGNATIVTDNTTGGVRVIGMVGPPIYTVYVSAFNHVGNSPAVRASFRFPVTPKSPNTGRAQFVIQ
jgi:hypothetical protein